MDFPVCPNGLYAWVDTKLSFASSEDGLVSHKKEHMRNGTQESRVFLGRPNSVRFRSQPSNQSDHVLLPGRIGQPHATGLSPGAF